MKHLHRVVWSKGMFLTPQIFETQDRFFEDNLQFRSTASQFANWGVTELAIDAEALANGLFTLQRCYGVFADGLAFMVPESDEPPAGRTVAEDFPPTQETLDVYLAIPERKLRGRNFTIPETVQAEPAASPASTRYVAETRMIPDEISGAEEKPVQIGKANFRLLFGGEARDGFTSLRIAQVMRNPAGKYIVNPRFVAPCLDVASSEYLMMLLRRQIEILANRATTLAAPRREKSKGQAEFTTSDVTSLWLLHTVNSCLPELKHIWTTRRGHPEPLYVALLRLAGALSTFSMNADPTQLPEYDHEDLGACFTALDASVRTLLDTVIPPECIVVALGPSEKFIWSGKVTEDQYFKNSQFYLSVSAEMGVADIIREVPRRIKIASPADIQRLIQVALPGITLSHTPTPPSAIRLKVGNQYFSLNQSGPLWDGVTKSRSACVFAPSEIVNPKMELLVVLGKGD